MQSDYETPPDGTEAKLSPPVSGCRPSRPIRTSRSHHRLVVTVAKTVCQTAIDTRPRLSAPSSRTWSERWVVFTVISHSSGCCQPGVSHGLVTDWCLFTSGASNLVWSPASDTHPKTGEEMFAFRATESQHCTSRSWPAGRTTWFDVYIWPSHDFCWGIKSSQKIESVNFALPGDTPPHTSNCVKVADLLTLKLKKEIGKSRHVAFSIFSLFRKSLEPCSVKNSLSRCTIGSLKFLSGIDMTSYGILSKVKLWFRASRWENNNFGESG